MVLFSITGASLKRHAINIIFYKFSYSLWIKIRIHSIYKLERAFSKSYQELSSSGFLFSLLINTPLRCNSESKEPSLVSQSQDSGWQREIEWDWLYAVLEWQGCNKWMLAVVHKWNWGARAMIRIITYAQTVTTFMERFDVKIT